MTQTQKFRQQWDLDAIFAGGSKSRALTAELEQLDGIMAGLAGRVTELPEPGSTSARDAWHAVLQESQRLIDRLGEAGSFLGCLTAQDVKDSEARRLYGRISQMYAAYGAVDIAWKDRILKVGSSAWQQLLADERFQAVAYPLREMRELAAMQMDPARETLATDLSVDGYHAWEQLYETVVGRITIPYTVDGKEQQLSVGQASTKFSNPDRAVRAELFAKVEEAWSKEAELIATALNHLAGFRLNLYRHRGWESVLKEPLLNNRMSEATLNAMWAAVTEGKDRLVSYMNRKAELLGQEKLHWYDLRAPISAAQREVSYDEAADFIVEHFGKFSPLMAGFATEAFNRGWIEAEDRPGKMPGGFCTSFPESRQTRIFMTFGRNPMGVATLAHELGHACHAHVMWDLPPMARQYAMNVAETASTFAELIVGKAAVDAAPTAEEKLALLDDGLQRTMSLFMDIHARFLFETRFYAEREHGLLSLERLNELMLEAQKESFRDALAEYHPHFWAAKGHFYATGAPFYNFPYTFGYLFSAGVYARALAEGAGFEQKYVDLLRDTGSMTTEELAQRHLGVDLTQPDFWRAAVDLVLADVDEFLKLTEQR